MAKMIDAMAKYNKPIEEIKSIEEKKIGGRKKKTHEEYIAELAIKNPNVEVLEEYLGANIRILHRYKSCERE